MRGKENGRSEAESGEGTRLLELAGVRRTNAHEDLDVIVGAAAGDGGRRDALEDRVLRVGHRACV